MDPIKRWQISNAEDWGEGITGADCDYSVLSTQRSALTCVSRAYVSISLMSREISSIDPSVSDHQPVLRY
jgi:hypothetical protein